MIFSSGSVLIWFWHEGIAGLVKLVQEFPYLLYFLEELEDWHSFFFKCWVEFTRKAIYFWTFLHWEVLITDLISLLTTGVFRCCISLWFRLNELYISKNLSVSLGCPICWHIIVYIGLPWWFSWVNNLPAVQETWVRSLGWEDPLEKGKATHSSILAWRILWLFILVSYNPFYLCGINCNASFLIFFNLSPLSLFFFFLDSIASGLFSDFIFLVFSSGNIYFFPCPIPPLSLLP